MRNFDNLAFGWIDASIGALLRRRGELFQQFEYAVVTSVDSTRDLTELREAREIVQRYPECRFLGGGLVLSSRLVVEMSAALNMFTGFDEIWCFNDDPTVSKPPELSLVAPLNLATDEIPAGLAEWMKDASCKLGFGDGIGLNFVTPDGAVGRLLEQMALA